MSDNKTYGQKLDEIIEKFGDGSGSGEDDILTLLKKIEYNTRGTTYPDLGLEVDTDNGTLNAVFEEE